MRKIVVIILSLLIPFYFFAQTSEIVPSKDEKQFAECIISNYENIGNLSVEIFDIATRGSFGIYSPKDREEMLAEIKSKSKTISALVLSMKYNENIVYFIDEDPIVSGIIFTDKKYVLRNPLKINNSFFTEELINETESTPNTMNEIRLLSFYFLTNLNLEIDYRKSIISL